MKPYRGRIAPTPTGLLHLGHAQTFWIASQRARQAGGQLLLRIEDLDPQRSREVFTGAAIEDLAWLGLEWDEGPDRGGPCAPYTQSKRFGLYRDVLKSLKATGHAYPCRCSRKDVREATTAPHDKGDEPVYPGTCRPTPDQAMMFDIEAAPHINCAFGFRTVSQLHSRMAGSEASRSLPEMTLVTLCFGGMMIFPATNWQLWRTITTCRSPRLFAGRIYSNAPPGNC